MRSTQANRQDFSGRCGFSRTHVNVVLALFSFFFSPAVLLRAGDAKPADASPNVPGQATAQKIARGKQALEQQSHIPSFWIREAYERVMDQWPRDQQEQAKQNPAVFARLFQERYGLHPAPYPNDGLPMGLRKSTDSRKPNQLVIDCMVCHGGSIFGQSQVGLPNTTLDLTLLGRDLTVASGRFPTPAPFPPNRTRGLTNAGAMGIFLIAFRNEDFSRRVLPLPLGWHHMPDIDAPAWWLLKKKKTMYCDGGMDATSTRSMMQFLLGLDKTLAEMKAAEPVWDDIRAYINSIQPPRYPFAIDRERADQGAVLFQAHCVRCHGTYGENPTYPNKIIDIDDIGTDRARLDGIQPAAFDHYNKTWYGQIHPAKPSTGYQAPPLDGIWATAPYLHNGSVPTIWGVLDSNDPSTRPAVFRRAPTTTVDHFDTLRLGWKVESLESVPATKDPVELRRVYDTGRFGNGNAGHRYGDRLNNEERAALIEYLKTL